MMWFIIIMGIYVAGIVLVARYATTEHDDPDHYCDDHYTSFGGCEPGMDRALNGVFWPVLVVLGAIAFIFSLVIRPENRSHKE